MKKVSLVLLMFLLLAFSSCLTNDTFNAKTQFKNDTGSISHYLKDSIGFNKISIGVWYKIDSVGIGIYPTLSDTVFVSYTAYTLPTSTSPLVRVDSAQSLMTLLSLTMAGWQAGLACFPVGSEGRMYIPSGLAYGQFQYILKNNNIIPANSNLLYKVKLTSVKGLHLKSDIQSINSYLGLIADALATANDSVISDPSGIQYYYDRLYKNNPHPTYSSSITVYCTGGIMGSQSLFLDKTDSTGFNNTDTTLVLKNQPAAWKIILPKMTEGTTVTFYVPSGYGYGSTAVGTKIPANSNLTYQVKIIKVNN